LSRLRNLALTRTPIFHGTHFKALPAQFQYVNLYTTSIRRTSGCSLEIFEQNDTFKTKSLSFLPYFTLSFAISIHFTSVSRLHSFQGFMYISDIMIWLDTNWEYVGVSDSRWLTYR